ncbi:SDR family NAD(P)-dependent oxidoreductase [Microbacteriaceae bacterium VKM Ac-2854]|nr:SDR family NAD(P)-dependent oxidoreductase [Microbacteriaceae bacterium VKM Ac-2854]
MSAVSGSVVLVVGASGGLGSRIAALLVQHGADVVRAGRAGLYGDGAYLAELRSVDGPGSLVAAALSAHGRLDGVVIASGVVAFGPAEEIADDALAELFETNAVAPIRLIRAAHPALLASATEGRHPFVLTISGVVAETPTAGLAAYSASKAALAAFIAAVAREHRRAGIRYLDARPGHTATALSEHPIAGVAPRFGAALDPDAVAARIVHGIETGERDLPSSAF